MGISVAEEVDQRRTKKILISAMIGLAVVVGGAGATANPDGGMSVINAAERPAPPSPPSCLPRC